MHLWLWYITQNQKKTGQYGAWKQVVVAIHFCSKLTILEKKILCRIFFFKKASTATIKYNNEIYAIFCAKFTDNFHLYILFTKVSCSLHNVSFHFFGKKSKIWAKTLEINASIWRIWLLSTFSFNIYLSKKSHFCIENLNFVKIGFKDVYLQGKNRVDKKIYSKLGKWIRMNLQDESFRLRYFQVSGKASNQFNELSKVLIWANFGKLAAFCLYKVWKLYNLALCSSSISIALVQELWMAHLY
jgi:hypothetical protein